MKKIISFVLGLLIFSFTFTPAFAENKIVDATFVTDLNMNKASSGQTVQFRIEEDVNIDGITLPRGTIIQAEVKHPKKCRFAFRRAKGQIILKSELQLQQHGLREVQE